MADKALVRNPADPEQVAAGRAKKETRRARELADVLWLVSDVRGRRIMKRVVFDLCALFVHKIGDERAVHYVMGQRYVGETLIRDLNEVAPEAYGIMLKEAGR